MAHSVIPLAICGYGRFASRRILPAVLSCRNIALTAVIKRSGNIEGLPDDVAHFISLEQYLSTNPNGAVYITTPNDLHAAQAVQCLEAGLHVLCEKPMANTYSDCQKMIQTAKRHKLYLGVGHMLRYSQAILLAQEWIRQGLLGGLQSVNAFFHYDLPERNRPWAFQRDIAGGGTLIDAGIHCIDTIRFLVGAQQVVVKQALTDLFSKTQDVEQAASCRFTIGKTECFVQVCSIAPYLSRLIIVGTKSKLIIENFTACWETAEVCLQTLDGKTVLQQESVDVSMNYKNQIRAFADKLNSDSLDMSATQVAAENVKIIEECYALSQSL